MSRTNIRPSPPSELPPKVTTVGDLLGQLQDLVTRWPDTRNAPLVLSYTLQPVLVKVNIGFPDHTRWAVIQVRSLEPLEGVTRTDKTSLLLMQKVNL